MGKTVISYMQPREKLQQQGAATLTHSELLQVLIGSGTAQASVSRIAKRSLKLITHYGSDIQYNQLIDVIGLGPARASQIIAAFELAGRYPPRPKQSVIDSEDKTIALMADIRVSKEMQCLYITVDGAKRIIAARKATIDALSHPSSILRKVFADIVTDRAAGVFIGFGSKAQLLSPSMFDLSFARDLRVMAQLFLVVVHAHLLLNQKDYISLKRHI